MALTIVEYTPDYAAAWDELVRNSRNGTFLFLREYMDYHADRFDDCSLLFFDERDQLKAVFPANRTATALVSHGGLTYGGLVYPAKGIAAPMVLEMVELIKDYARRNGIGTITYKAVPHIYHRYPAEEDIYALVRAGAVIERVELSAAIDLEANIGMDSSYRRYVRLAQKAGVQVQRSYDFAAFWKILEERLGERYAARPVHSLAEMQLLAGRFPDNIRLYTATVDGQLAGGTVMYFTDTCAHSQYIATNALGRSLRVLPALFAHIIATAPPRRWFDFGTSCEDHGRYLNEGLIEQKFRLGGRGIAYSTYTIQL